MAEAPEETDNMEDLVEQFRFEHFDNSALDILALAVLASEDLEATENTQLIEHGESYYQQKLENVHDYGWAFLPEILLEDIFVYLSPKYRHNASQVCWRWYRMFYSPRVWEKFVLDSVTLTKRQYHNWNRRELIAQKAQMCLSRVGRLFKHIVIEPLADYYNLHQFLRILASFLQFNEDAMPLLTRFEFTFSCETHGVAQFGGSIFHGTGGSLVHGTGGQILEQVIAVMRNIRDLHELKLNHLLLDTKDAPGLFSVICDKNSETLNNLEILNFSKMPFPLALVAQFWSLNKLSLSPQQLDDEVVLLLAATCITELRIVQDRYTQTTTAVSAEAWKELRHLAPFLSVRLDVRGQIRGDILIQPSAPVKVVVFSTPHSQLSSGSIISLCDHYADTLEVFAQESIPKISGSRSFHNRGDTNLLMIANKCRRLKILIINDRVSTSTALLVSHQLGKMCERLVLRRNALIKRCDWPKAPNWSHDFYDWLRTGSRCYDKMSEQISQRLGRKWEPLKDSDFKKIKI